MSLAHFKRKANPLPPLETSRANALDALGVASVLGLELKLQGRHAESDDGLYRGTEKDGKWVWCHKDGSGIGDNTALAMCVLQTDFVTAVKALLSEACIQTRSKAPARPSKATLTLPPAADHARGRAWLQSRGISLDAIQAAEAVGFLRYSRGAVLFVACAPAGTPKAATRRGYLPTDLTPKRDLKGSDKAFPGILPGSDVVWLVEGGADALAAWTLARGERPTVIVTGGAGCRAFIEQPHVLAVLQRAKRIYVACDNEKDQKTQAKTDEQHRLQAELIREKTGIEPVLWWPPSGCKDVADFNKNKAPGVGAPEGLGVQP